MDTHIGHYRLLEKLGSGGMGVVYKAEDTLLKRIVALKFPPESAVADENSKRRFLREAQAASALDHPNICSIHSVEATDDGRTYICMSWCEGSTLRELLAQGRLELADALDVVMQVGRGLEAAHHAHIVHRDIKPGNIMVSSTGQAKVLDFGIARITDATQITTSGSTLGTVRYMSPEHVKGETVDTRSDIWSLGVVLYEAVTGVPPFTGDYEAAVLYSIVSGTYEPASRLNPGLPPALDAVIHKALQKKPDARYGEMADMIADLEAIRSGLESPAAERAGGSSLRRKPSKRMRIAIAACGAAVAIAALLLTRFAINASQGPPRALVVTFTVERDGSSGTPTLARIMNDGLAQSGIVRTPENDRQQEIARIDDFAAAVAFAHRDSMRFIIALRQSGGLDVYSATANVYDTALKRWIISEHAESATGAGYVRTVADMLSSAVIERLREYPGTDPDWRYSRSLENYLAGEERFLAGDPEASMAYFQKSLEYDSSFVETLMRLAIWESYAGNAQRARELAARARSAGAGNTCLGARTAIVELRTRGEFARAVSEMKTYLHMVPDDASMYLDLGYVLYHDLNSAQEAIPYLRTATAVDPDDYEGRAPKAYDCLANANADLGQFHEAESYLQKYLTLLPGNVNALHSLASISRVSGHYQEAIERYEDVIAIDPAFFPTYDELSLTYLALGRPRDALREIESYYPIAQRSLHARAYILEGRIHLMQADYAGAESAADSAFAIDSLLLKTRWLRGRIALAQGDLRSARDNLEAMIELGDRANDRTDTAFVHNLAGWIHLAAGDTAAAFEELRCSAGGPVIPCMFFRRELIRACIAAGKPRNAERLALEALVYNENDAEILYLLGSAYDRLGNRRNAIKYYERAKAVWADADEHYKPYGDLISKLRALQDA